MEVAQHPGLRRFERHLQRAVPQRRIVGADLVGHRDAEPRQIPVEQQLDLDLIGVDVVGRQRVDDMRRDRDRARQLLAVQRDQHIDRRRIALLDRRRRIAGDHGLGAEVFDDEQAVGELGLVDLRGGEAELAQPVRHADERHDVLGEMGDRAVGLAVAHRRAVRPARRVHQDGALVAEPQPLVGARRGVALDALSFGQPVAARIEETADDRDAVGARREGAIAGDPGLAVLGAGLRLQRERDVETVRRQEAGGAVRPFQQHDGLLGQIVEAKLGELARTLQPVQVGVHHREARQVVGLHQREGRARHRDVRIVGEIADHGAGEGGLAGAEIAGQRHQIAGLERRRDVGDEAHRGLLVGERHGEARSAGGEGKHCRPWLTDELAAASRAFSKRANRNP